MSELRRNISITYRMLTSPFRALPHFIIIGAQKSGTRSLFKYLTTHPQIEMTFAPETHYFDLNNQKGMKWYAAHFPKKRKGIQYGECSPYYLFHPAVPRRIHKTLPDAKFIVLLRDPVSRAFSHYKMRKERGEESNSIIDSYHIHKTRIEFEEKEMNNRKDYRGRIHQKYSYLQRGSYQKQIKRWFSFFDKSQFIFIDSDEFFNESQKTMDTIFNFLGLSSFKYKTFEVYNKGSEKEQLAEEDRIFLEKHFHTDNKKLFELLNMKFNW